MNDDQFTQLFKYLTERFDEIDKKIDSKASQDSMDKLINTLDGFVKRLNDFETEQTARLPIRTIA